MEAIEQLISRTDAAYQRWLAEVTDDVAADTTGLSVFCRESLLERNTTYEVGEWLAGYLMIGQEGDRGYFLRCDGEGGPVFSSDLGALGSGDLDVVAPAFEVWLQLLGADWRVADLRSMLATQPFLAARSAQPWRVRGELKSAPELRQHLFYVADHRLEAIWAAESPEI